MSILTKVGQRFTLKKNPMKEHRDIVLVAVGAAMLGVFLGGLMIAIQTKSDRAYLKREITNAIVEEVSKSMGANAAATQNIDQALISVPLAMQDGTTQLQTKRLGEWIAATTELTLQMIVNTCGQPAPAVAPVVAP